MVSIPNYVTKEIHKLQHPNLKCAQYAPHKWTRPKYGATKQLETTLDTSPPISEEQTLWIQHTIGTLLYYACAVD